MVTFIQNRQREWEWKKGVQRDEKRDGLSLSFCTSPCRNLVFFSVCAPSRLAPGAFLGPTSRGVGWFLGSFLLGKPFLMECIPSFFCCVWVCLEPFPPYTDQAVQFILRLSCSHFNLADVFSTAGSGHVVWKWCVTNFSSFFFLFFFCIIWCRSFFVFFCLLVALNIMSGDLKTM